MGVHDFRGSLAMGCTELGCVWSVSDFGCSNWILHRANNPM